MALKLPEHRISSKKIQTEKRKVPFEQIMALKSYNPLAQGIEVAGNLVGQALQQRAALRQQGEQLAKLEALAGEQPGAYAGLDPQTASVFTKMKMEQQEKIGKPTGGRGLQFAGMDESGNPIVFNPNTGALQTGGRQTQGGGALLPKQKKILPGALLQDIKNQESAISLLETASNTSPEIMSRSVGLVGGVIAPKLAKVPGLGKPFRDPERAVFQQNVKTGLLKFLYSEAGKQLSDPERAAVTDAIGSVDTPIEEFKPKLDGALSIIKGAQTRYIDSLGESGYIAPGQLSPIEKRAAIPLSSKELLKRKLGL